MATITLLGNFRVDYTSESHHAKTLESLGHNVLRLQEGQERSEYIYKYAKKSDLFVWVHTHGWKTHGTISMERVLKNLRQDKVPSMTYHLDLWFGLQRQNDLEKFPVYKNIDHFFTVDKKMAKWFDDNTFVKGHYLPAGVFDQECYYENTEKIRDIIFVGSKTYHPEWPYRPQLINWLSDNYKNNFEHYGNGGLGVIRGDQLNKLYASTKIVIGDSLCPKFTYPYYWSDRVYETLGRGGFLIHPYVSGMEKEFVDKEHLVFYKYGNFNQLKKLINYYLENDDEREKIRIAGHKLVKEKYTYKNRWQIILKELNI